MMIRLNPARRIEGGHAKAKMTTAGKKWTKNRTVIYFWWWLWKWSMCGVCGIDWFLLYGSEIVAPFKISLTAARIEWMDGINKYKSDIVSKFTGWGWWMRWCDVTRRARVAPGGRNLFSTQWSSFLCFFFGCDSLIYRFFLLRVREKRLLTLVLVGK